MQRRRIIDCQPIDRCGGRRAWIRTALRLSRGVVSSIGGEAPERRKAFRFLAFRLQLLGSLEPIGKVLSNLGFCPGDAFRRWLTMHRRRGGFASAQDASVGLGLAQFYFQLRYSFAACRGARRKDWPNQNQSQSDHHVTCEGRSNRPAHIVSRFGSIQLGLYATPIASLGNPNRNRKKTIPAVLTAGKNGTNGAN